ncbi:ISL3 family transposase [Streptomyces sp. NWU339]|uniref:ISL3 family transposase n=1 Tax=Streptomyces sp. NWU339 TaxID=2185284 RepID=UPI000D6759AA|nr:ISL3 family transposase [Streptomyces sp. NWU339]PWI06965.1 ISL3 family transposase [Streptomyces sp. NWU339]
MGLDNDTTLLLDLDGLAVARVERLEDGTRRVHLITADEQARACPEFGVFATRVKGSATTRPRDLPYGESGLELRWHKRRWWCREPGCPRRSFTEQIPQIPAGARITMRLRSAAGRRIRDAESTVIQAARDLNLSWPTVMDAFRTAACEVTEAPLPEVQVLGIDETRRGRPRWEQDPDTGKWHLVRERWHTGFVDALGTGGLLGQVEGRTVADVLAWLATTPLNWRKSIAYVAIDMSTVYRAAVRTALPHATVVVDHFHVVQLANKMLSMVRRRTTAEIRGRRGRASDPEWKARRRLLRNREDLTDEQFTHMWNALLNEGKIGQELLTAWIAKENLRNLLALARTSADQHQVGQARWKFLTWCADSDIPEVRQLAVTVDRWWPEIGAFIDTGHSNAKSEGINRVIKLVARNAFGFHNAENQRLRTRCVTTRRARGHLRTAQLCSPVKRRSNSH